MNMHPTHDAPPPASSAGTFLVCVDAREESLVALRFACLKASKSGATIKMLHVIPPSDMQGLLGVTERMRQERQQEAQATLARWREAVQEYGPASLLSEVREGPVGDEVLHSVQQDVEVNIVILGVAPASQGNRGKLSGWLAGQLGNRLLVPLVLVPGNLTDQQLEALA